MTVKVLINQESGVTEGMEPSGCVLLAISSEPCELRHEGAMLALHPLKQ